MKQSHASIHVTLFLEILLLTPGLVPAFQQEKTFKIPNLGENRSATGVTDIDGGPCVGMVLNVHYFPGIFDYIKGNYYNAIDQMNYVLRHPPYLDMNPKKDQYLSLAHYVRAMIYLYHAEGLGRLELAKEDFEQSILLNANNFFARLELARTYSLLGLKQQAIQTLQKLLELNPEPSILQQARQDLDGLKSRNPT